MATVTATYVTPEEYLARERKADTRSEYLNGQIFAMAGGTPEHALLALNLAAELRQALKESPCRVYSSDLRLGVATSGLYTYPDVTVVCGDLVFADDRKDTVTNPVLLAEVLSDSTKDYDRGEKFQHYRTLASLQEYLTVAQDTVHVEQYTRQPTGQWLLTECNDPSLALQLSSLGIEIKVADIYAKVKFGTPG